MSKSVLHTKDVKLIVEVLVFCSTPDVSANWKDEDHHTMIRLAEHIKSDFDKQMKTKIKLDKLEVSKRGPYENSAIVKRVKKLLK